MICTICGTEFEKRSHNQILCGSKECKAISEKLRMRRLRGSVLYEPRPCKICGVIFTPVNYRHTCCSDPCRRTNKLETNRVSKKRVEEGNKAPVYYPLPLRRPFTDASRRMILEDIRKGRSFEWMGRMYGRDAGHIREEVGRWQARL